jgi:hypothetical protein
MIERVDESGRYPSTPNLNTGLVARGLGLLETTAKISLVPGHLYFTDTSIIYVDKVQRKNSEPDISAHVFSHWGEYRKKLDLKPIGRSEESLNNLGSGPFDNNTSIISISEGCVLVQQSVHTHHYRENSSFQVAYSTQDDLVAVFYDTANPIAWIAENDVIVFVKEVNFSRWIICNGLDLSFHFDGSYVLQDNNRVDPDSRDESDAYHSFQHDVNILNIDNLIGEIRNKKFMQSRIWTVDTSTEQFQALLYDERSYRFPVSSDVEMEGMYRNVSLAHEGWRAICRTNNDLWFSARYFHLAWKIALDGDSEVVQVFDLPFIDDVLADRELTTTCIFGDSATKFRSESSYWMYGHGMCAGQSYLAMEAIRHDDQDPKIASVLIFSIRGDDLVPVRVAHFGNQEQTKLSLLGFANEWLVVSVFGNELHYLNVHSKAHFRQGLKIPTESLTSSNDLQSGY